MVAQHDALKLFGEVASIVTLEAGISKLESITLLTDKIKNAIYIAIKYHANQKRKSGEDYVVHPICVASIIAFYGGDEAMICAALLHDVVEDTNYKLESVFLEFGDDVGSLVDALTKISEVRKEEFDSKAPHKVVATALTFRKMLVAAIKDSRALVIKISDRLHNMLTLHALPDSKRRSISEETLVVYGPIAHRLGISSIKNELEDLSFMHLFPEKYKKIQAYLDESNTSLSGRLNAFISKIRNLLLKSGFVEDDFVIESRIKRPYSIHLKMQRKGISIDEILDLLAIRIITHSTLACYKILGIIHSYFKPIISRFKDYLALPKENGYQTIHTTIFNESLVYEVQIRTFDMHKSAQFGIAAHWKYKSSGLMPNMDWLNNFEYQNQSVEEFYELAKNDLYQEDIVVFSPDGDTYNLPVGSIILDYAYAVHTEVGNHAKLAFVNNKKSSLLARLRSGDIVNIIIDDAATPKYTWIDEVKTSKAKSSLRTQRRLRIRDVEQKAAINMLAGFFNKPPQVFSRFLSIKGLAVQNLWRVMHDNVLLSEVFEDLKRNFFTTNFFVKMLYSRYRLKAFRIDKFRIHSVFGVNSVIFDCCCYPRHGDEILGVYDAQKVIVHHKLCDKVYDDINQGAKIVSVAWDDTKMPAYKVLVNLEDRRYGIEKLLGVLSKNDCTITGINYEAYKSHFNLHYEVIFESKFSDIKPLRDMLDRHFKIIDFVNLQDAYQN